MGYPTVFENGVKAALVGSNVRIALDPDDTTIEVSGGKAAVKAGGITSAYLAPATVSAKTADYDVLTTDNHKTLTNFGAGASVEFDVAAADVAGVRLKICRVAAFACVLVGGAFIFGEIEGTTLTLTTTGCIILEYEASSGKWIVESITGGYTLE